MESDARLQPHLGRVKNELQFNKLAVAKVTKVHHRSGTCDLQLLKTNSTISSSESDEGKYSARIVTSSAHFDRTLASSSGVVEPYMEGQLVLVAFVDGVRNQAVILGSLHSTWESEENVLTPTYPLTPQDNLSDRKEAMKYLRVHPSQFYHRIDGLGGLEMSHPSKTFLQVDADFFNEITDAHGQYDHIHLNEADPYTGQTRSARSEETAMPVNILLVHRSSWDDEATTWTKLFVDKDGMLRITRDGNDGNLSFFEMSQSGAIKIRRQNDSNVHGDGANFSEMGISENGNVEISKTIDGKTSSIFIDDEGDIVLNHKDGNYIRLSEKQGGSSNIIVSKTQPVGAPEHSLWVDISDIQGV